MATHIATSGPSTESPTSFAASSYTSSSQPPHFLQSSQRSPAASLTSIPSYPATIAAATSSSEASSSQATAPTPSFVSLSSLQSNQPQASTSSLDPDASTSNQALLIRQPGQPAPSSLSKKQRHRSSRSHQSAHLQSLQEDLGAAFHPPSPSASPPLILSYRSSPSPIAFPSFASLLQSLPAPVRRQNPSISSLTADSTPAPSSVSTHPSSPTTADHPDLTASILTEATSIADSEAQGQQQAVSSTTASTPQGAASPTAPKPSAWGTPKSWADALSRNGRSFNTGPIGVSVNVSDPASSVNASEIGSPSRSPKAGNARKARKSDKSSGAAGPQIMSLERLLADSHHKFDAPLTYPRGLVNKGNFCFANAILQTLVYCGPFYNLFALIAKEVPADFGNTTPLMEAVIHFIREFALSDGFAAPTPTETLDGVNASFTEPFLPEFVYDAMRLNKRFDQMRRGHQEDAEEFLGFFLDTLHEELLSAQRRSAVKLAQSVSGSGAHNLLARMSEEEKKLNGVSDDDLRRLGVKMTKSGEAQAVGLGIDGEVDPDAVVERELLRPVSPSEEGWMEVGQKGKTAYTRTTSTSESPITRIFGGKLRSVLKTPGAKDSVTLEPYQPLQLDIQPSHVQTVEDALLNLTQPEIIPGVWSPSRAAQVDATKQVFIESLPPILVLHLKRFIYDEIGGVQKSSKPLAYGTTLEIAPEVLSPTMRAQGKQRYRLFGVVYHHGRYANGGHYTVDVLRQDGQSWLHIDDTVFQTIPTEQVVRKLASTNTAAPSKDFGHDGLAYLLFYRREREGEAAASQGANDAANKALPGVTSATTNATVNGATKHAAPHATSATAAKGKANKAHSGLKTPNGSNSAASSPRVAHQSPKVTPATAPAKRIVPGWDR